MPEAAHIDAVLSGAYAVRGHAGQIAHKIIKGRDVELGKRGVRQHLNRDRYVLEVFPAAVGGDNDLARLIVRAVSSSSPSVSAWQR